MHSVTHVSLFSFALPPLLFVCFSWSPYFLFCWLFFRLHFWRKQIKHLAIIWNLSKKHVFKAALLSRTKTNQKAIIDGQSSVPDAKYQLPKFKDVLVFFRLHFWGKVFWKAFRIVGFDGMSCGWNFCVNLAFFIFCLFFQQSGLNHSQSGKTFSPYTSYMTELSLTIKTDNVICDARAGICVGGSGANGLIQVLI